MSDTQQQNPGLLANILAVAGFIILIVIIVWGAYHLLRLTGSGISSLFSRFTSEESGIAIRVPADPVRSGEAFSLSWEYEPEEAGTYAFLYQCRSGFRFEVSTPANTAVPCGSAFTVGTETTLSLIPMLSGTTTLDVPVSVVFMPSATTSDARSQGTATISVIAGAATSTTPAAPAPSPTTSTAPRPQPTGTPDLSVQILAVGVIDPVTGAFIHRYPTGPDEVAAVRFNIANVGTASTGTYYFTVNLPLNPAYTYTSVAQPSLTPGSRVENILRFKPVQPGGGTIYVTVDPSNAIRESNENNNSASQFIAAPLWTGSYAPYVY